MKAYSGQLESPEAAFYEWYFELAIVNTHQLPSSIMWSKKDIVQGGLRWLKYGALFFRVFIRT